MTSINNLTFLTNNVKGFQSSKKRMKLIEYFKSKLNHQPLRMKVHGSMILMAGFLFSWSI